MKHQYFGDVNDYRKYGLVRALAAEITSEVSVVWALTPPDGGPDGKLRSYLTKPGLWHGFDPDLFVGLRDLLGVGVTPNVSLIEASPLLAGTRFFSAPVPDSKEARRKWTAQLLKATSGSELVFLDPDNGLEVPSRPVGRKGSSKYVFWEEVSALWSQGASVLIYQHFRREKRDAFISRMAAELHRRTGGPVETFRTPHVLFLLACQTRHLRGCHRAIGRVSRNWGKQILPGGFLTAQWAETR